MNIIPQIIIIALVMVVSFWDMYVIYCLAKPELTVSAELFRISCLHPIIPFAVGFVLGHVFWPNFVTYR